VDYEQLGLGPGRLVRFFFLLFRTVTAGLPAYHASGASLLASGASSAAEDVVGSLFRLLDLVLGRAKH
jgi:hypothetical protein